MAERDEYEVGYRRPPREHRFAPGVSGNPRGRPKGGRGFKAEIEAALSEKVTITDKGRRRRISMLAALLKRLVQKGVVDGDLRAIERLIVLAMHSQDSKAVADPVADADDLALIADFLKRSGGGA